jgi:restriction endonuclease S subunit
LFRGELVSFNDLEVVKKDSISHWENYLLKEGDMLFARGSLKREGAGKLALVRNLPKEDIVFSGFTILFRNESENDNLFLNYLLRSPRYRELFPRIAVGTTITNLNQEILRSVPIILPPLPEQKAIAKILSDLDAKIELNNKMNRTLEAIGQALFKKWFIDNPEKENWVKNHWIIYLLWNMDGICQSGIGNLENNPVFGSGRFNRTHDNFFVEGPGNYYRESWKNWSQNPFIILILIFVP